MKTYAESGVDIKTEAKTVSTITSILKETFKTREGKIGSVIDLPDQYANLIDLGDRALAMSTDGVGSKVLIAEMLGNYSTIGIDMVAMVANDLICIGAEPLALVDYYAVEKHDEKVSAEIARGISEGAKQAGMAVIGGETATLPDIIKGAKPGTGFDLAGTGIATVDKEKLITGNEIRPGDIIIGLESSGPHSNGYSLLRAVLLAEHKLNDSLLSDATTIGAALIEPTRIYVKPILNILNSDIEIHGMAHITGSGLLNLKRLKKGVGFEITYLPEPFPIFKAVQEIGEVPPSEMYSTFNMNTGFIIVAPPEFQKDIIKFSRDYNISAYNMGTIVEDKNSKINIVDMEIFL